MKYNQYYGGLIWTHHALDRLMQRGLSQDAAWQVFKRPDATVKAKKGGTEYRRKDGDLFVTLVAKQNQKREWVIISAWVDPPLPGSPDAKKQEAYRKYQKASGLVKLWLTLKRQIGL